MATKPTSIAAVVAGYAKSALAADKTRSVAQAAVKMVDAKMPVVTMASEMELRVTSIAAVTSAAVVGPVNGAVRTAIVRAVSARMHGVL